jgi:hypothetical protein
MLSYACKALCKFDKGYQDLIRIKKVEEFTASWLSYWTAYGMNLS